MPWPFNPSPSSLHLPGRSRVPAPTVRRRSHEQDMIRWLLWSREVMLLAPSRQKKITSAFPRAAVQLAESCIFFAASSISPDLVGRGLVLQSYAFYAMLLPLCYFSLLATPQQITRRERYLPTDSRGRMQPSSCTSSSLVVPSGLTTGTFIFPAPSSGGSSRFHSLGDREQPDGTSAVFGTGSSPPPMLFSTLTSSAGLQGL